MSNIADFARLYHTDGRVPIPIPIREKGPRANGWQNTQHAAVDLGDFEGECNVGVLLGAPSRGLVDADLDCPEAVRLAFLLPKTPVSSGREHKGATHYWYECADAERTAQFRDPTLPRDEKSMILELRANGGQTVVPPSIYPDGDRGLWQSTGPPTVIAWSDLHRHVSLLAAAALLARHWPGHGSRHEASLALAGALERSKRLTPEEVGEWIGAIARTAGDEEHRDRANAARTTARRLANGERVTGLPTLAALIDSRVVAALAAWLELGRFGFEEEPRFEPNEDERADREPRRRERRARTIRLADVEPEAVNWLWPGRIPLGALTVIDGDPGLGKSTVALDLAARVSTGRPMPDGTAGPGASDVIVISYEDQLAATIRPRLDAAGADTARVHSFKIDTDDGTDEPEFPTDLRALEEVIADTGAALVIVDPLMAALGGSVNTYRDQDVRRVLAPLARIAEEHGCAVVAVRHLRKSGGGNPLYAGGGSIGIIGAARSAQLVALDPQDPERRVLARLKCNLAESAPSLGFRLVPTNGTVAVDWLGTVEATAGELLAAAAQGTEERTERDAAKQWLLEALSTGPRAVAELRREAHTNGIADRTLDRAKGDLKVEARKGGMSEGWTWSLPIRAPKYATKDANPLVCEPVASFGTVGALRPESTTYAPTREPEIPKSANGSELASFGSDELRAEFDCYVRVLVANGRSPEEAGRIACEFMGMPDPIK